MDFVVSPDSKFVLARDPERKRWLYPLPKVAIAQPFTATLAPGEDVIDWEKDGNSLLVLRAGVPANVFRVNLGTSKVEAVKTFSPSDPAGVVTVGGALKLQFRSQVLRV